MVDSELISQDYVAVDIADHISKLIGHLKAKKQNEALVFDKKKFVGIADPHFLIKSRIDPVHTKVKSVVRKVHVLNGGEDLSETAGFLLGDNTRILPIMNAANEVVGVVQSKDLIKQLSNTAIARSMVKDIMKLNPITLKENDRTGSAINIMKEHRISRIPIVDENGVLTGITSVTDFLYDVVLRHQSSSEAHGKGNSVTAGKNKVSVGAHVDLNSFPIKNIATQVIVSCTPDETIGRVIDKLDRFGISSMVVVEDKKPVGIVSTRDLLKLLVKGKVTY